MSITRETVKEALKIFPKEVITAEEILRHRVQTFIRIALATAFFWIASLISIGANAIAQVTSSKQTVKTKTVRHRTHYKNHKQAVASMRGKASWYGHKFHNRQTASGKLFDQDAYMAAHRTLPFGTLVKVTNTKNNRSCVVEITDRGPYVGKRIIDVSRQAARDLGFADAGITDVTLEVITPFDLSVSAGMRKSYPLSDVLRMPEMAAK